MVVVVPRHHREELVDRPPPAGVDMHPGAPPVTGLEPPEEFEGLAAPPRERDERHSSLVGEVLALLRPAGGDGGYEPRLVHRHDELHPSEEPLLVVAPVANDLGPRPSLR